QHVEVPVPTPSNSEVLLKLEAISLNPVDWKTQKGMLRPLFPRKFPFTPTTDVAGKVVEVGPGVKNFKPGDKVVTVLSHLVGGGLSEYAVAKENVTVHVTATCGARNIELVKNLGADEVLDYKTPEGAALKSPSGKLYDAVIHCASAFPWSVFEPNLSEKGKVVDITPGPSAMWTFAIKKLTFSKKKLVPLLLIPKGENLKYLVDLVKEGKIKTIIDSKHSLSKAEDAWSKSIEGHATGKIIVEP
ncbi:hypothetical protein F511_22549, partial [Dorcoceras hygrometricum]